MTRPNFVMFVTDQHRADHLGCYGNDVVKTPSIDGIAERGVRFDRFMVANPVCMPNRASLMTGRMPTLHGVRHNGISLSTQHTTFVELLAAAGYRTALMGKSHLQNFTPSPPLIGPPNFGDKTLPPKELSEADHHLRQGRAYENENPHLWRDDPDHHTLEPFYGFDTARICTDHGDRAGSHYIRWLKDKGYDAAEVAGKDNALPDNRYSAPQAWRTRVPEEVYPTNYVAELSIDWIKDCASGDDPFFIQVSFPDPHHPYTPPGKYWDMYDPDEMTLPESFGKGTTPALEFLRNAQADGSAVRHMAAPFAVTEEETRQIIALTYGMITMVDDAVARVLATLQELGVADDTVVLFTADHGDAMGEHGIMLKHMLHYMGLLRVPFLWADPVGDSGAVRSDFGQTIDISASILARAGLAPFNGLQGRDLFGGTAAPDDVLVEEDAQQSFFGVATPSRMRTLVTDDWRISLRHGLDWGELFDLRNDPMEIDNLWDDPAHRDVRSALLERMLHRIIALSDTSPLPTARA